MVDYSSSPHNDSGVDMNIPGNGSLGDLSTIGDPSTIEDKIQDNHVSSNMGPPESLARRRGGRGGGPMMAVTTQSQLGGPRVASPMVVKTSKRRGGKPSPGNTSGSSNRLAQRVKNAQALPSPLPPVVTRSK